MRQARPPPPPASATAAQRFGVNLRQSSPRHSPVVRSQSPSHSQAGLLPPANRHNRSVSATNVYSPPPSSKPPTVVQFASQQRSPNNLSPTSAGRNNLRPGHRPSNSVPSINTQNLRLGSSAAIASHVSQQRAARSLTPQPSPNNRATPNHNRALSSNSAVSFTQTGSQPPARTYANALSSNNANGQPIANNRITPNNNAHVRNVNANRPVKSTGFSLKSKTPPPPPVAATGGAPGSPTTVPSACRTGVSLPASPTSLSAIPTTFAAGEYPQLFCSNDSFHDAHNEYSSSILLLMQRIVSQMRLQNASGKLQSVPN